MGPSKISRIVLPLSALAILITLLLIKRPPAPVANSGNQPVSDSPPSAQVTPPQGLTSASTKNSQAPVPKPNGSWPIYRGNNAQTGRADLTLPDKLKLLWTYKTAGEIKSSPVIHAGRVFVGSADKKIHAVDQATGVGLWQFPTGSDVEAPPCVIGEMVVAGSLDEKVYALEAATGKKLWDFKTEGQIPGSANFGFSASPQSAIRNPQSNDALATPGEIRLLVGSFDHRLYCLNPENGNLLWRYETGNYINGAPAVMRLGRPAQEENAPNLGQEAQAIGIAIFGGCDAKIHMVNVETGQAVRVVESGAYIAGSAAIENERIYVGNYDNNLLCVDALTGATIWKYSSDEDGTAFFSSPALGTDLVLVGARDKKLHAIDKTTGQRKWVFPTGGEVDSSPVLCGDKVVFGSADGRLYLLRIADGKEAWSYDIGKAITSSPAVAGGMVIIGAEDGNLYAFGTP